MATKVKKKKKNSPGKKAEKLNPKVFKVEKDEKIDWKALARDERTWKIIGAVSLLVSIFLFIAFTSYLFTWKEDQDKVFKGAGILIDNDVKVSNLLGRFGAFFSHFFIYKGFGIASFLICTFFFVVGVNLLFNRKVFSIWRNLKYVTVGLLVLSVILAFIFSKSDFAFGGGAGAMISNWLVRFLGTFGTAALLFVLAFGYIIWQFNPVFNFPKQKNESVLQNDEQEIGLVTEPEGILASKTINDRYNENNGNSAGGNLVKSDGAMLFINKTDEPSHDLKIVERDEPVAGDIEELEKQQPTVEMEIVNEIYHKHDLDKKAELFEDEDSGEKDAGEKLELEIKNLPAEKQEEKIYENLPPYEPTLDLRDYKYPTLSLLETYGGDKIVQDANELENNKNQIINTLSNYDIQIQKISATVGPTVTLYEIVPAPGVRISRIKNLEDDIALSLAALGIRIIAPIPGKGTIGIEVPNAKKSIVSMKSLLSSEKFQLNNYSLPIAIGKKIDNDNYIVDLASMPHLLMAGATGQGKSVGINAILISLLYKKHPSQLKLVLIDPKKVELSLYRLIEKHFLAKLPGEDEAIITDTKKVVHTLNALCIEMDNRYDLLKEAGARNIKEYNEKF
ncbi:MAG: DNA translocase FtsK, partial [Bacteroidia bacterium]|nr:DNA translocase FtsK [Bacteroidia bacterium]